MSDKELPLADMGPMNPPHKKDIVERLPPDEFHVPDVKLDTFQSHANGLRRISDWMMTNDLDMQSPESEDPLNTADLIEAQAAEIERLRASRDDVVRECSACIDRVYYNDGQPLPYLAGKRLRDAHDAILALIEGDG